MILSGLETPGVLWGLLAGWWQNMSAVIEFDHVSKRFRLHRDRPRSFQELFLNTLRMRGGSKVETIWSLRDVSFSVQPGEIVGLVGPNGAGKSTALKLISRIIAPTHGRVLVQGKVTGLLELGAGFHPDLTGRENVYLNGAMLGMKRKQVDQRLEAIVAFAELEQFIDVPVKHYSSGMYMRLGFATAVYADVDVLLVDEVLAVGDQAFQSKCYQRINELRCAGTTILFVSHDAATVRRMCDRAVFLDKGQVRSIGAADDVIADYMDYVWQERNLQDVQAQECTEQRWGSGEVVIEDVVFLAQDGNEQRVFADAALAVLILKAARKLGQSLSRALVWPLLYTLSPIAILVSAYHGQFDAEIVFLLALSWYFWRFRGSSDIRVNLSALLLGFAVLNKTWPLLFLPIVFLRLESLKQRVAYASTTLTVPVVFTVFYITVFHQSPYPMLARTLTHAGVPGW